MTTTGERWEHVRALFAAVRELPTAQRESFLQEACPDAELRAEVETLVRAHSALEAGAGGRFLALDAPRASALLASGKESEAEHDPEGLAAGEMLGRYRVVRRLGQGGMGVVYLAHDVRLDRLVALKLLPLHLSLDDTARRRFEEEARAASALDHPHIATVYEISQAAAGRIFLAMAFYDGETLRQKLERGPVPAVEAVTLATQIADALDAAHARGIVHRDIKPANVIVTPEGAAKIVDFGIAKIAGSVLTQTGATLGTVAYMSPEQTRGEPVDARTDLWSLGVVLYEMLTWMRPFRGEHDQALIYAIRHDEPEPLRRVRPEVPGALVHIVERCLRKDPAQRYVDAGALLAELRAFPAAPTTAAARPLWREPSLRYGSLLGILVLLLAGAVALWPPIHASDAALEPFAAAGTLATPRLAVLPLANLSPGAQDAYFADGLTDELISHLSQLRDLRVIARSSAMRYKGSERGITEIARELEVGAVLQGSVYKAGDHVRIRVQLSDPRTEQALWSEEFEREVSQVTALQREIARRVAAELNVRMPGQGVRALTRGQTEDAEAYDLSLQGRYLLGNLDAASFMKARDYFQQALQRDPGLARAWSGLADAYDHLAGLSVLPGSEGYPRSRAAAERALELDPGLADAHASLAMALVTYYWDSEAAERHFRRAIELNPSYARARRTYATHLRDLGRFEEALAEVQIAQELDPLSAFNHIERGLILYMARRPDEALEQYRRLLRATPGFTYAYLFMGLAHIQKGEYDAALTALQTADPKRQDPDAVAIRGVAHALAGRQGEARQMLAALDTLAANAPVSAFHRAVIHAPLGEHEHALAHLEQAVEERTWHVRMLGVEPIFTPLRAHPRFRALLEKLGLAG